MKAAPAYRVRVPTGEDLPALSRFARKVLPEFPEDVFGHRWWWNHDHPMALIAEHVASGEVAGLCGGRENRVWISGEERDCISICDWYVAPDHIGRSLGIRLINKHKEGKSVLVAMQQTDESIAYLTRVRWQPMFRAPMFLAPLPRVIGFLRGWGNAHLGLESHQVRHGEPFDDQAVDTIWSRSEKSMPMVVRDARTLRLHLSLMPRHTYTLVICRDGERPVGYMLARLMPPGGVRQLGRIRVAAIVDFLVDPAAPKAFDRMLAFTLREMGRQGAGVALTMTTVPELGTKLLGYGFVSHRTPWIGPWLRKLSTPFMFWVDKSTSPKSPWYLTLADSDQDLARP